MIATGEISEGIFGLGQGACRMVTEEGETVMLAPGRCGPAELQLTWRERIDAEWWARDAERNHQDMLRRILRSGHSFLDTYRGLRYSSNERAQANTYSEPYLADNLFQPWEFTTFNSSLALLRLIRDYIANNTENISQMDAFSVLYPASGSHAAVFIEIGLALLNETDIENANFIYTEINEESLSQFQSYLVRLASAGLFEYVGKSIMYYPNGGSETYFQLRYTTNDGEVKTISILFALNMSGEAYYLQSYFDLADIVVAHDAGGSETWDDTVCRFLQSQYRSELNGDSRPRTIFMEGQGRERWCYSDRNIQSLYLIEGARVHTIPEEYGCRYDASPVYDFEVGLAKEFSYLAMSFMPPECLTCLFGIEENMVHWFDVLSLTAYTAPEYSAALEEAQARAAAGSEGNRRERQERATQAAIQWLRATPWE